jgi:hypothetical protein
VHFYISQSDKGELVMGGDLDFCNRTRSAATCRSSSTVGHAALFPSSVG